MCVCMCDCACPYQGMKGLNLHLQGVPLLPGLSKLGPSLPQDGAAEAHLRPCCLLLEEKTLKQDGMRTPLLDTRPRVTILFPLALSQMAATGSAVSSVCFTLGKQTVEQTPRPACTHSWTSCADTLYSCHTLGPHPPYKSSEAVKLSQHSYDNILTVKTKENDSSYVSYSLFNLLLRWFPFSLSALNLFD